MAQPAEAAPQQGVSDIWALLGTWANNFTTQTEKTFSNLRTQDYIRLVVIIGGYALLRPYLMKLGAKLQMKSHERDSAAEVGSMHPNELRGGKKVEIPGVDSDSDEESDEEGVSGGTDWGRKARLRQRKFIRQRLEEHEKRLMEEKMAESDDDIKEFLVD